MWGTIQKQESVQKYWRAQITEGPSLSEKHGPDVLSVGKPGSRAPSPSLTGCQGYQKAGLQNGREAPQNRKWPFCDEEASQNYCQLVLMPRGLQIHLLYQVNTERDRNLLRAAPHDRIRARTGSGVLHSTLCLARSRALLRYFLSPGCLPWRDVCHHVHHPGLLLLLLPTCLSCPFSAPAGAGTLLVNRS